MATDQFNFDIFGGYQRYDIESTSAAIVTDVDVTSYIIGLSGKVNFGAGWLAGGASFYQNGDSAGWLGGGTPTLNVGSTDTNDMDAWMGFIAAGFKASDMASFEVGFGYRNWDLDAGETERGGDRLNGGDFEVAEGQLQHAAASAVGSARVEQTEVGVPHLATVEKGDRGVGLAGEQLAGAEVPLTEQLTDVDARSVLETALDGVVLDVGADAAVALEAGFELVVVLGGNAAEVVRAQSFVKGGHSGTSVEGPVCGHCTGGEGADHCDGGQDYNKFLHFCFPP
jgi:hypothetical protein